MNHIWESLIQLKYFKKWKKFHELWALELSLGLIRTGKILNSFKSNFSGGVGISVKTSPSQSQLPTRSICLLDATIQSNPHFPSNHRGTLTTTTVTSFLFQFSVSAIHPHFPTNVLPFTVHARFLLKFTFLNLQTKSSRYWFLFFCFCITNKKRKKEKNLRTSRGKCVYYCQHECFFHCFNCTPFSFRLYHFDIHQTDLSSEVNSLNNQKSMLEIL